MFNVPKIGNDYDMFLQENKFVIDHIIKTVVPFSGWASAYVRSITFNKSGFHDEDKVVEEMRESAKRENNLSETYTNLINLDDNQKQIIKNAASQGYLNSIKRNVPDMGGFNPGVNLNFYGNIDRHGEYYRKIVSKEIDELSYKNEVLNKKVFNIDSLIYVSLVGFDYYCKEITIEFDALLIRYMSTLPYTEMDVMLQAICLMILDKLVKVISTMLVELPILFKEFKLNSENTRGDMFAEDMDYVGMILINKIICDSANGVSTINDNKTIKDIINTFKFSFNRMNGGRTITNTINNLQELVSINKKGKLKFIDELLKGFEFREEKKFLNLAGKSANKATTPDSIIYTINDFRNVMNTRAKYSGMENRVTNTLLPDMYFSMESELERINNYTNDYFSNKDNDLGVFGFMGTESLDDEKLEKFKRKTRALLLTKLSSKERNEFISLEADIIRYASDCINCNNNTNKTTLLMRSKGLSKLISIEMSRKNASKEYIELLAMIEEKKYESDNYLTTRDFMRERNTRLYGQILPTGDFDY